MGGANRRSDIPVMAVPRARRPAARVLLVASSLVAGALLTACAPPAPADPTRADDPAEGEAGDEAADARAASGGLSLTASAQAAAAGDQLVWLSSEREALQRGRDERRPVLVHFDSQWCADCKRLKQETFGDPRVKAQAGRFVAVRIDATNDEDPQVSAVLQKYTVINVPTLILLDSSGHEQRRITELVSPETLLHEIDQVH
jgi:thiol-disulfide isomerase/thioredoxin